MSLPPSQPPSLSTKPTPPRRVPPPCWTHEETLALIESYHEKWYILRRGNLKASHWQEVADNVARRCRFAVPSKTSVQCRHKIEKLRKRYRTEKQRAAANAPNRYSSSWNFFKKMDDMEKGPLSAATGDSDENGDDPEEDDEEDEEEENEPVVNNTQQNQINSPAAAAVNYHRLISNGSGSGSGSPGGGGSGGGGYRFRIPSGSRSVPSPLGRFDGNPNFNPNPNHTPNSTPNNTRFMNSSYSTPKPSYGRSDESGRSGSKRELDPMGEMVSSIRMLGEGFVKMEQKKIEMAKEMEQMRMEMEMKRTEMILESQQKFVEAFAKGISASKKMKRMPSPE